MSGNGHHHHGNGCGCGHEHDDDHIKPGEGQRDSLYSRIDRANVTALNELRDGMARETIKPYDQRDDEQTYVESDADDQLIIRIPFTGSVKLRALQLKCGPGDETPSEVHVYANQEALDFDACSSGQPPAQQKLSSIAVARQAIEYPLKTAKFNSVQSVTLFIPGTIGQADRTRIYYIGFKGEFMGAHVRQGPTNVVYESAPQVKDHKKIPGIDGVGHMLGPGS